MDAKQISVLHDDAMNLAEEAFMLLRHSKKQEAKEKCKSAFLLEMQAVTMLEKLNLEPSLSIMTASAAWLAKDAGLFVEADSCARKVIVYNMDSQLIKEMHELLEDLN